MNVIARLEFKLAYSEAAVQHISHYATGIHTYKLLNIILESTICILCIYPTSPPWIESDTRWIFNWSTAGLKSEFSFFLTGYLTNAKELKLTNYSPIAEEGRTNRLLPFQRTSAWSEKQTAESRIWTQVDVSIY